MASRLKIQEVNDRPSFRTKLSIALNEFKGPFTLSDKGNIVCWRPHWRAGSRCFLAIASVFEIPQVPHAFEFESEWPNGNLTTEQSRINNRQI